MDRRPADPDVGPGAKSPVVRTLRVVGAVSKPRGAAPRGPADSGGGARLSLKKVGGKNTRGKPLDPILYSRSLPLAGFWDRCP